MLAVTGLYSAWLHVGNLAGLRDTAYGHSLMVKLLLLSPVLALAAVNLLLVSPRIKAASNADAARWARRFGILVAAESVLGVAVLFRVGRLTAQPPARDEITLAANQVTLGLDLQGHPATLTLAPGLVGPNHYRLDVAGDPLPADAEAVIRLTAPSVDTSQKEVVLSRSLGNVFEWHGAELSFAGDWKVQIIVRKIGGFQWSAQTSLPVTATNATALPRRAWHFGTVGIVGLLLLVAGVAGLALAWRAGRSTLRRESAGLGAVMLALGAVLLVQAWVDPAGAISLDTQNPIPFESASIARGKSAFLANCTTCHGVGGHGDSPLAPMNNPPAADLPTAHTRA
ncbi:MAG: CopD family protein, partial [Thermomicrobiales bacterium]